MRALTERVVLAPEEPDAEDDNTRVELTEGNRVRLCPQYGGNVSLSEPEARHLRDWLNQQFPPTLHCYHCGHVIMKLRPETP